MKIGDWVKCISNGDDDFGYYHITIGKRYKILDIANYGKGEEYCITNDLGYDFYHESDFFMNLQRKEKLDKINSISRL